MRHPTGWVALGAAVVIAIAGCAHPEAPAAEPNYGVYIGTNTPQGLRARQLLDMVNSDWPIGVVPVATFAIPQLVEPVAGAMDRLWSDRPIRVTGVEYGAGHATLHVVNSYAVQQDIELRTDGANGLVDRFEATVRKPRIAAWPDVDTEIQKAGPRYSYQVSRIDGGRCVEVAGTNVDESLPLASIFKLYVLLAVADSINAGTMTWDEPLTITKEIKAVGSAGFDKLEPGATVPVRDAAQQMISASDNMATDLLIARLGPGAVERALVAANHHDPASMTPFPTAHEMFSVGWGKPDVREQWKHASRDDRATLLRETNARPYEPDPMRTRVPASPYGAEWYGNAMDICRVHAALQEAAHGPAAAVRDILSATPGIDLDRAKWPYVAAKGGNLPGDITFSWYAEDRTDKAWVVSFQLNWPEYRSLTAATWLLHIATGAFGLIPMGPATR